MRTRLIGFLVIGTVLLASSTLGTLTDPGIVKIRTSGEVADLWIKTDDTNRESPVDPKLLIPDIAYHPPVERPARQPDPATHRKAPPTDFRAPEKPATEEEGDLQTSSEIALLMTEYQAEEAALLRDRAEWVQQIRDSAAAAPTEPMRQREAQLRARAAGLAGLRAAIERIRKEDASDASVSAAPASTPETEETK